MAFHAHHRKDINHDDISQAFELFGFVVIDTSQKGLLDLFVYKPRQPHIWFFIEVKTKKWSCLSQAEAKFILDHPEHSRIIRNADQVKDLAMGRMTETDTIYEARQFYTKKLRDRESPFMDSAPFIKGE